MSDLIGYYRTKREAQEEAADLRKETGRRYRVFNITGVRARKWTYDKPWQVREVTTKEKATP